MVRDIKIRGPVCTSPVTDGKSEPIRALPASWYTSPDMYQLERRAIFTSKWMLITHEVRVANSGDWLKFECAGYEYVITRDRKNQIHAFHNTCRHRAYPVVEGTSGRNQILACKYHGWSYGLDGKLAKAPWYEDVENFDKSRNNLFRVHVRTDINGFIWVNLNSSDEPEPWEKDFANIDQQERYEQYNFKDYVFDREFEIDAETNWKVCVDNFNECYHCPTSHPNIPTLLDIDTLRSDSKDGYTIHTSAQSEEQKRDGLQICTTYYFPNVSTNVLYDILSSKNSPANIHRPHYIMLQRFLPQAANRTKMHYQIFRNKSSPKELFDLIDKLYEQVMREDKALAVNVQRNMERGMFVNGELHPRVEGAALHHMAKAREAVKTHAAKEKASGRQIWPAAQAPNSDAVSKEDEEFCAGLACGPSNEGVLAW